MEQQAEEKYSEKLTQEEIMLVENINLRYALNESKMKELQLLQSALERDKNAMLEKICAQHGKDKSEFVGVTQDLKVEFRRKSQSVAKNSKK